jgi:hypothetical protein
VDETSRDALTTDPSGSLADGAAHDDSGGDEQRDLKEYQETSCSSEGPHRSQSSFWLALLIKPLTI